MSTPTEKKKANKAHIRKLQAEYAAAFETAILETMEVAMELTKRNLRKKTNPSEPPLLDGDGNPVDKTYLNSLLKLLRRTNAGLLDTYLQIEKDNKIRNTKGAIINVVSDTIYQFLESGLREATGMELKDIMEEIAPGSRAYNIVETSSLSNRIIMLIARLNRISVAPEPGKKQGLPKSFVDDTFLEAFAKEDSARLVVQGEEVTAERGLSNHSQPDIDALEAYKNVPRTTIIDVLKTAKDNNKDPFVLEVVDGEEYLTYNSVTLSRSIIAMGTVPSSFLTDEERDVIMTAKALPGTTAKAHAFSAQLKEIQDAREREEEEAKN